VHQFAQKSPMIVTGGSLHMPMKSREADGACEKRGTHTIGIKANNRAHAFRIWDVAIDVSLIGA
jgi:hypothetical protein